MTKSTKTVAAFDWADPLVMDDMLTDEERLVRDSIRRFCQEELQPRVLEAFREEKVDRSLFPRMGELGLLGSTIEGYRSERDAFGRALAMSEDGARLANNPSAVALHVARNVGSTNRGIPALLWRRRARALQARNGRPPARRPAQVPHRPQHLRARPRAAA